MRDGSGVGGDHLFERLVALAQAGGRGKQHRDERERVPGDSDRETAANREIIEHGDERAGTGKRAARVIPQVSFSFIE